LKDRPSDLRATPAQALNAVLRRIPASSLYLVGAAVVGWLFWLAMTGGLGVDPVKEMEHRLGEIALQLMVAVLVVSPLRRFTGVNLLRFRRAIGVLAFVFVALHLLTWAIRDGQMQWIWADIVKRPYITVGMAAFVLMLPLALTSNNGAVRRLGAAAWGRLHLLTYPAAVLGALHYVMLVKAWPVEPFLYLGAILALLALRLPILRRRSVSRA